MYTLHWNCHWFPICSLGFPSLFGLYSRGGRATRSIDFEFVSSCICTYPSLFRTVLDSLRVTVELHVSSFEAVLHVGHKNSQGPFRSSIYFSSIMLMLIYHRRTYRPRVIVSQSLPAPVPTLSTSTCYHLRYLARGRVYAYQAKHSTRSTVNQTKPYAYIFIIPVHW